MSPSNRSGFSSGSLYTLPTGRVVHKDPDMSVITTIDQVKSLTYGVGGASGDKGKNEEIYHVDTFDRSAAMSSAGFCVSFIL